MDQILTTLTPEQRHSLTLALVQEYPGVSDSCTFHRCEKCGWKECERHGQGPSRDFEFCSVKGCLNEICLNCWWSTATPKSYTCIAHQHSQ